MIALLEQNRDDILALCNQYGVRSLEVFGSAVSDDFDQEHSDIDLLVEFESPSYRGRADRYFGLKFALEALLDRRVDLVMNTAVKNPYLRKRIDAAKVSLHAAA